MAATYVTANSVYDGSTRTITVSVTAGDFLICFFQGASDPGTGVPTDNDGNTWTNVNHYRPAGLTGQSIAWAVAGSTRSLTVTIPAVTDPGGTVQVWSGVATTTPVRVTNYATGSTSPSNVTLSGVLTGDLIVEIAGDESAASTYAAGAGYDERTNETSHTHATLSRVAASDATYTPNFTITNPPAEWVAIAAAFIAAAGGGPTGSPWYYYAQQ